MLFWNVKGLSFKIGNRVPLSLPQSKTIQKDVTRKNGKIRGWKTGKEELNVIVCLENRRQTISINIYGSQACLEPNSIFLQQS